MTSSIPEVEWGPYDDLCDCVFQRIQWMTNPYIGRTMEVRMCCIWAELYKMFPQFMRDIPGYDVQNVRTKTYEAKPAEWNGEFDMPRAIWHRQLAVQMNLPLSRVRELYGDQEPPRRVEKGSN